MARSKVRGAAKLRRRLRSMPDYVENEVRDEFNAIGQRMLARAKAEAPRRTGRLAAALAVKVLPRSLNMKLGLLTKARQRKFFYGYILDRGRRAQVVKARRRTASGVTTYAMRVRAIAPAQYDFVFGRMRDFRANELPRLRRVLERALTRVARGGISTGD